ncbi:uncharacterized protein CBL_13302 [Carabus blaptoides fortunei]
MLQFNCDLFIVPVDLAVLFGDIVETTTLKHYSSQIFSSCLKVSTIVKFLIPSRYRYYKSLEGEVVLVTGAAGGLGRLLVMRLAKLKAIVVLWDIDLKAVEETVRMVEAIGGKAHGYKCDLANREDVYRMASLTQNEVGQVTILINNAGVASGKLLLDTPDYMIQKTFEVNILAHFWTTKAFLPGMMEKDHGHIVTIASMAGYVGIRKLVDYCSSKFAAVGFDEALRVELEAQGVKGVKTTVICPYFIQATGMFENVNSCIPTLKANDVADRIIQAIQQNEKFVLVPEYLKFMLIFRWIAPWKAVSLFLRALVPDASPCPAQTVLPTSQPKYVTLTEKSTTADVALHHRITTASERKP